MCRKILAVDDERHIVRLVQMNLQQEGYMVDTAGDGREALAKIAVERPDLILLDVMMPYIDGFEVLRQLKDKPETRDIPVVMMTVKAQDADIIEGWKEGSQYYLTKPFSPVELKAVVKQILSCGSDDDPPAGGAV